MNISSRQRMALGLLIKEQQEMTVAHIAEHLQVSTRTVHRELADLDPILKPYGLTLQRKSGSGVRIMGGAGQIAAFLADFTQSAVEYTAAERRIIILSMLLASTEPLKLFSLAVDTQSTVATVSHDLDELELWLEQNHLTLLRKRGYGVKLEGAELAKRQAISSLITDHIDEADLLSMIQGNVYSKTFHEMDPISRQLLGSLNKETIVKVVHVLEDLEHELSFPFVPSAYLGLIIHLVITIERIAQEEQVVIGNIQLNPADYKEEWRIAKQIIGQLSDKLQIDFPESEVALIAMHLKGAKLSHAPDDLLQVSSIATMTNVRKLIKKCEKLLSMPFIQDTLLFEGLLAHVEPALYRIEHQMPIRNSLLVEIKKQYAELFEVVKQAAAEAFPAVSMPDEEIGYLVMHLGASLERRSQASVPSRALIVCSTGIGTSHMLASRIRKELPEIEIVAQLSWFDVADVPPGSYDLLISTIALPLDESEYIVVNPLLSAEGVRSIRGYMERMREQHPGSSQSDQRIQDGHAWLNLKALGAQMNAIISLLEHFQIYPIDNGSPAGPDLWEMICGTMAAEGFINDQQTVLSELAERGRPERITIPNSMLAFLHARADAVLFPSLSMFTLSEPIEYDPAHLDTNIHHIICMLAPKHIGKEELEMLSEISVLLLDPLTIEVLESLNKTQITAYFAEYFLHFHEHKSMKRS
jgi:mannitol operon transcriptional antiterminator